MNSAPNERSALFAFAAGTVLVSFSAPIVKLATTAPTVTAFYRMLAGGLILALLVVLRRTRPQLDRRSLLLAGICALAFACDLTLWHRSIRLVGPGLATILVGLQVFFMAGFGLLAGHEKLTLRIGLGIPLAITGLLMIVGVDWRAGESGYRLGVVFGLTTALCYTTYLIALRRLQDRVDLPTRMANIAVISLLCALLLGIIAAFQHESFAPGNAANLGLLVLYGIIGQVLAWVLMSRGLPQMRPSLVGLLLLLQPLLSAVWDVVFFRRPTTLLEAAGAAVALGAIYLGASGGRAGRE